MNPTDATTATAGGERDGSQRRLQLFHFSDDPGIEVFEPRPVRVPSDRQPGFDWLNGPLVWAVTEDRQATYLFPRDCPRILLWLTDTTTENDRAKWWGERACTTIAHIEWAWFERVRTTTIYRYALPADSFRAVGGDAWMRVSDQRIEPLAVEPITDLFGALRDDGAEVRLMATLAPLRDVWATSLHASGIRLRNATGWPVADS